MSKTKKPTAMKMPVGDVEYGECFTWEEAGIDAVKTDVGFLARRSVHWCYATSLKTGALIEISRDTIVLHHPDARYEL